MRLVLAAADPPAELVELGEPVALGALDQHHGRVGDVDPDLDHGRRDEHVGLAGGERLHRRRLLARRHLAVEEPDAEVGELARARAAPPRRSRPCACELLRLGDERADDVGLAALAQPLADELVGAGALLLADDPGLDRPAAGRAARASVVVSRSP